ncbi:hypothetical protein [Bartonella taylorii]|uniref:hypothetical protein n=1 Tax=Bartonella taylorii TaxID=33046 RepID=UPI001FEE47D0|nr:hypothetical protein [Bartonella taylorii]
MCISEMLLLSACLPLMTGVVGMEVTDAYTTLSLVVAFFTNSLCSFSLVLEEAVLSLGVSSVERFSGVATFAEACSYSFMRSCTEGEGKGGG